MINSRKARSNECGATLVEFSIAATVFFLAMFAVLEFGRALWVHNALTDAVRRGARYAVLHDQSDVDSVKNVVVYDDPNGGTKPLVENLSTSQITVEYSDFQVGGGTATVSIDRYDLQLTLPMVGGTIRMPSYATTLTGESAGFAPPNK